MRHRSGSSLWRPPFAPFATGNIFEEDATALARNAGQVPAKKIANQLNYDLQNYAHWYGYTGPGYTNNGGALHGSITSFTPSIYFVPLGQPTQKVTLLENPPSMEPRPPGANNNLQAKFEAVPMPTLSKVPSGNLVQTTGTDKEICIIQGKQMWEFWKLEGAENEYVCHYGSYIEDITKFNGILPNDWGARATSLALIGGMISLQDLAEIQRKAKNPAAPTPLYHAIGVSIPVTAGGFFIAPATRNDEAEDVPATIPTGKGFPEEGNANPCYPNKDAVSEASWFAYPAASHPTEFGIRAFEPIATWLFECVRKHGLFVCDGAASVSIQVESMQAMGSPYAYCPVNPVAGSGSAWNAPPASWVPAGMASSELAPIEEGLGAGAITSLFETALSGPAYELEYLEPRSS